MRRAAWRDPIGTAAADLDDRDEPGLGPRGRSGSLERRQTAPPPMRSFSEMLEKLFSERFTGAVTLHFAEGRPKVLEIPQPPIAFPLERRRRA